MIQSAKLHSSVPLFQVELTREKEIPIMDFHSLNAPADFLHQLLDKSAVEQFIVMYLDSDERLIGGEKLAIGTSTHVEVSLRDLFRGAIVAGADGIMLGHNHVQGKCAPSQPDIDVTAKACLLGEFLNMPIIDHVIVSPNGQSYSMMSKENASDLMRRVDDAMMRRFVDSLRVMKGLGSILPPPV